jgi:transposase InsO family protein
VRAPKANAFAERFVRTARAECLDWLLIVNRRHLERVLRVFIDHYNTHRPHRALSLMPPAPTAAHVHGIPPPERASSVATAPADSSTSTASRHEPTLRTPHGTVRRECLDRILIVNRHHLERVLPAYISHYNEHRPHRSLYQRPPIQETPPGSETVVALDRVLRRDVLGGLIHECGIAA